MAQMPDVYKRRRAAPRLQPDVVAVVIAVPEALATAIPAPVSTTAAEAAAAMAPLPNLLLMCHMLAPFPA
jgi:hypothetical protein